MAASKTSVGGAPAYSFPDAHGKTTTVTAAAGGGAVVSQSGLAMTLHRQSAQDLITLLQQFLNSGGIT